jgi:purine-nucleoside phosphorylase
MKPAYSFNDYSRAADFIRRSMHGVPEIGIILGTGVGSLAESVESAAAIPYARIPLWPPSTVKGHEGSLVVGMLEGKRAAVLRGRVHLFEGYTPGQIAFPVRVLRRLGVNMLIVTNAAGAVNPDFQPGELMLIADHLNLIGLGGANPLVGPNDIRIGPRFPDMSRAYDPELRKAAVEAAAEARIALRQGVYAGVAGPSFETPAELRYLRAIGADAVGMSTVAEVIAARHAGMRVLGISVISNRANLDGSRPPDHDEVLKSTEKAVPGLCLLLRGFIRKAV